MAVISKELKNAYCSEFIHPWCDNCVKAFLYLWKNGFKESVKLYTVFYMISSVFAKRQFAYYISRLPIDILRSSLFLSLNGSLASLFICAIRVFLKFNTLSTAFIPSVLASMTSILFERNSRRQQLCVYMINIAIQTIYLVMKSRGYISSIKNGEVLLFCIAASGISFLYVQNRTPNYISNLLKYLFGSSEVNNFQIKNDSRTDINIHKTGYGKLESLKMKLINSLNVMCMIAHNKLNLSYKMNICTHDYSCFQYIIMGFHKPFIVGVLIEYGITVFKTVKFPFQIIRNILKRKTYQLGWFLGLFSIIFRAMQCGQRRAFNKSSPSFSLISGFIAGLSNKLYPSVSISMYSITKLVELCIRSYGTNYMKSEFYNIPLIICLYSLATAFVFDTAILEPENVPKAYIKFLNKLTGNKLDHVNRFLDK